MIKTIIYACTLVLLCNITCTGQTPEPTTQFPGAIAPQNVQYTEILNEIARQHAVANAALTGQANTQATPRPAEPRQ